MANNITNFNIKINGVDQLVDLNDIVQTNVRSLKDLKEQQDILQQAFEQADYGTESFNLLQISLKDVNSQLKSVEESVEGLTIEEVAKGAAQGVAAIGSAFAFATTSIQAFGDENSLTSLELQKLQTRILAIQQGFTTFSELTEAFTAKNGLFRRSIDFINVSFTKMGISAKGSGLAIRGALAATGIGLLVVGITALIENFDQLKALAQPLITAFEPFFNSVRDIASLLSGGLISDSTTNKILNTFEKINKTNETNYENSSKRIDELNKQAVVGIKSQSTAFKLILSDINQTQIDLVRNAGEAYKEFFKTTIANLEKQKESGKFYFNGILFSRDLTAEEKKQNDLIEKRIQFIKEQQNVLNNNNKLIQMSGDKQVGINAISEVENKIKQNILTKTKELSISDKTRDQILGSITKREEATLKFKTDSFDVTVKQAEYDRKIANLKADLNKNVADKNKIDLDNFRELVDLTSQLGILTNANKNGSSNAIKQTIDAIKVLRKNIDDPELNKFFNDGFLGSLEASQNTNASINKTLKGIELIRIAYVKLKKSEISDINERAKIETEFVKKSITDKKEQKAITDLIEAKRASDVDNIRDKYRKLGIELTNQQNILIRNRELTKEQINENVLNDAISSLERFTSDVQISQDEVNKLSSLFSGLGIDFTKKFNLNTLNDQNKILEETNKRIQAQLDNIAAVKASVTNATPEENDLTQKQIDLLNTKLIATNANIDANNKLKQSLIEQTVELENQYSLEKQRNAISTEKDYSTRNVLIKNYYKDIRSEIENTFNKETKGLKVNDERYIKSLTTRKIALDKASKDESKALNDSADKRLQNIKTFYSELNNFFSSAQQLSASLFDVELTKNDAALSDLQTQLETIQNEISSLDERINTRKSLLNDLESQANDAVGAQRQEILNQIDVEFTKTQKLIEQKRSLANQEKQNALEQQKLTEKNIRLQKQATQAANALALAQAAVAVANAFTPDTTSTGLPLGIGLAIRAAAALSFIATLYSTINSFAEGGYIRMAEGGVVDPYGYTNKLGVSNKSDSTGERPTKQLVQLHEGEYVIKKSMVNNPKYRSTIVEMERDRVRGMAEGGFSTPITTNNKGLEELLLANLNKPIYVSVTEINKQQSRVSVLENRSKY